MRLGGIEIRRVAAVLALVGMAGCGGADLAPDRPSNPNRDFAGVPASMQSQPRDEEGTSLFSLLGRDADPSVTIEVNKYIWNASLDVLNFLPLQSADPFTGVIVTGYGTPPGGGRAYRATIYVRDPALEGRSLNVALATRNGPASAEATRAVEDAILTRARQLRIRDLNL